MKDLKMEIEQTAMCFFDERRKALRPKMSVAALAEKVFPGVPNSRMIIQRIRKPQANGRPRAMSLGEFVEISRALNVSPLEALGVVLNRIDETKIG